MVLDYPSGVPIASLGRRTFLAVQKAAGEGPVLPLEARPSREA